MIRTCIYCGAELPGQTGFCGNCGQPSQPAGYPIETPASGKSGGGYQTLQENPLDGATTISASPWENTSQSSQLPGDFGAQPSTDDEEEEKRRKAAMPGFGLLGIAGEGLPPADNVPVVHGTPQISGVPMVQGTPQNLPQGSYSSGFYASQTQQISHVPLSPAPYTPQQVPHPPGSAGPHPPGPHYPNPGGCAPAWLILVFAAILIITSIIGIGLTVLSPGLSLLSGSTNVTLGGTLQLHGQVFFQEAVSLSLLMIPRRFTSPARDQMARLFAAPTRCPL
jgi:hypothetical protein